MYWPVNTPKCFATSSNSGPDFNLIVSDDGLPNPFSQPPASSQTTPASPDPTPTDDQARHSSKDDGQLTTPATPVTPAVQPVDHGFAETDSSASPSQMPTQPRGPTEIPLKDPILALRVSRSGHLFVVITATSMTIWQSKVGRACPMSNIRGANPR